MGFRVGAALCVFVWVVGIALCATERVCICADDCAGMSHASHAHDHDAVAAAQEGHSHEAGHHHDEVETHEQGAVAHQQEDGAKPESHGCAGGNCGDGMGCCSTIQALAATAKPMVIPKPVSQLLLIFFHRCATPERAFASPNRESLRPAKPRDWVFTPEVCLGPALHSLAPPVSA